MISAVPDRPLYPLHPVCPILLAMPEITARLSTALADRYRLERHLGEGGMANVYLAEDVKHKRKVAVKVLRPELVAAIGAERFLREIEVTANLQHPHILPLHDSGEADGFLYYVMPFVDGESLRGVMNRKRQLELPYVLRLAGEVAGALGYAHRQDVLHRDIKPENILLSEGHAVVADFGIAKALSTARGDILTRTGFAVGTPGYMSPEQAAGNAQLDARSDVFSLACVVYEMLTGETPGLWPTEEAVRIGRFFDAPPTHRERLGRLPVAVERALTRAMAMRANDRFDTPDEFARALVEQPGSRRKYSEGQVREIVGRAAEAEAHHRTEDGALSLGGLQQIGAEVGIPPERIREAAEVVERALPTVEKSSSLARRFLKHPPDTITARRVVEATPREVLSAMEAVFPGEPFRLTLTDQQGDPLDRGVLVFDIQGLGAPFPQGFALDAKESGLRHVFVSLRPIEGSTPSCEMTVHSPVTSHNVGAVVGVVAAALTGGVGFGVGVGLGVVIGIAPLLPVVAVGGVLVGGGLGVKGFRAVYAWSMRRGQKALEGLIGAVAVRAQGVWKGS